MGESMNHYPAYKQYVLQC